MQCQMMVLCLLSAGNAEGGPAGEGPGDPQRAPAEDTEAQDGGDCCCAATFALSILHGWHHRPATHQRVSTSPGVALWVTVWVTVWEDTRPVNVR